MFPIIPTKPCKIKAGNCQLFRPTVNAFCESFTKLGPKICKSEITDLHIGINHAPHSRRRKQGLLRSGSLPPKIEME